MKRASQSTTDVQNEETTEDGGKQTPSRVGEPPGRTPRQASERLDYSRWTLEELRWLAEALGGDADAEGKSRGEVVESLDNAFARWFSSKLDG
jgi:hypothetical protein